MFAVKSLMNINPEESFELFMERLDFIFIILFMYSSEIGSKDLLNNIRKLPDRYLDVLENELLSVILSDNKKNSPARYMYLLFIIFGQESLKKIYHNFNTLPLRYQVLFLEYWEPKDDSFVIPMLIDSYNSLPLMSDEGFYLSDRGSIMRVLCMADSPSVSLFFKNFIDEYVFKESYSMADWDIIVKILEKLIKDNNSKGLSLYIKFIENACVEHTYLIRLIGPSLRDLLDNISDDSSKNKIINTFYNMRKQIYEGKPDLIYSYSYLSYRAQRRFLYVEPLEGEPDEAVKAFPSAESDATDTGDIKNYARVWTKETDVEGAPISKKDFEDYLSDRKAYKIFIVDDGEFDAKTVGAVFLEGTPFSLKAENLVDPMSSTYPDKLRNRYLGRKKLIYRVLFFTLMKKGSPKEIELINACWDDHIENLKGEYDSGDKGSEEYYDLTNKYRKAIERANLFLENMAIEVQIIKEDELYVLTRGAPFCLIKLLD